MPDIVILGYGENVLSLVLETLRVQGHQGACTILQNMALENKIPFIPAGMKVNVVFPATQQHCTPAAAYLFGVAAPSIKMKVFSFFSKTFNITRQQFMNLVHPSSVVAGSVSMQPGCYIEPLTVVSPFASLGFGVTINRKVSIGHHTVINDFATINPGVDIGGTVSIGSGTQVGIGTKIFEKISIGNNTIIGGGSVVTKDIPGNVIAWGNPCIVRKENGLQHA